MKNIITDTQAIELMNLCKDHALVFNTGCWSIKNQGTATNNHWDFAIDIIPRGDIKSLCSELVSKMGKHLKLTVEDYGIVLDPYIENSNLILLRVKFFPPQTSKEPLKYKIGPDFEVHEYTESDFARWQVYSNIRKEYFSRVFNDFYEALVYITAMAKGCERNNEERYRKTFMTMINVDGQSKNTHLTIEEVNHINKINEL